MAVEVISRADGSVWIKNLLIEKHGVKDEEFGEEAEFEADYAFDSLESTEFAMNVEQEFGVAVPDDDLASLRKVGDAIDYIVKKLSG